MLPKQANPNFVAGSALQDDQQQSLIDFSTPEAQTVQEGSQPPQWKADHLAFTGNQSFQQRQQKNEFFKLLKKSVKGFADWPTQRQALAVSSVGAIVFAALPILAILLPLAATGAVVGLALFFTVKAVSYAFQGLKWSLTKLLKGLGYVAEKTVEGSKKGYESSRDSLKRGASNTAFALADKFYNAAGKENYAEKLDQLTPEEKVKSQEIKKDLKAVFDDKGNNTRLINNILSKIVSKIDLKIVEEERIDWVDHTPKWEKQKKFIKDLSKKDLHSLLIQRSLPKDIYLMNSTFSEHYDDIKEVIKECKQEHLLAESERKAKKSSSLLLPESKSSSVHSTSSLPNSGSLNSVSTDGSTAELLSPTEHKKAKRSVFSFTRIGKPAKKNTTEVGYKAFSEESSPVETATIKAKPAENRVLTPVSVPKVPNIVGPPKPPRASITRSHSLESLDSNDSFSSVTSRLSGSESASSFSSYRRNSESGIGSSDSSPRHSGPQMEIKLDDLTKAKNGLNRRHSLQQDGEFIKDPIKGNPSTQMDINSEPQVKGSGCSVQ